MAHVAKKAISGQLSACQRLYYVLVLVTGMRWPVEYDHRMSETCFMVELNRRDLPIIGLSKITK